MQASVYVPMNQALVDPIGIRSRWWCVCVPFGWTTLKTSGPGLLLAPFTAVNAPNSSLKWARTTKNGINNISVYIHVYIYSKSSKNGS